MRARPLAAAFTAFALGAGVAACGGQHVSEKVPRSTPEITVSEQDLTGLGGETAPDRTSTDTTPTTPSTTPSDTGTGDTGAAPSATPGTGATAAPSTPAPATGDTGGATQDQGDTGASGDTGGAGFQDFCQQNPGAC